MKEIINQLNEASYYIEEVVGTSNLEEHHYKMLKGIDNAVSLIKEIKNKE